MICGRWTDVIDFDGKSARRWQPKVGDRIEGYVLQRALGMDRYGLRRVCVIISAEGREQHIWLLHEDLKAQFRRKAPDMGDYIVLERLEDLGRKKRYRLVVDRQAATGRSGPELKSAEHHSELDVDELQTEGG